MADVSHHISFTADRLRLEEIVSHIGDTSLEFRWKGFLRLLHRVWKILDHEAQIWEFLSYLDTDMPGRTADLVLLLFSYMDFCVERTPESSGMKEKHIAKGLMRRRLTSTTVAFPSLSQAYPLAV